MSKQSVQMQTRQGNQPQPNPVVKDPSGSKVLVGCKLPQGLHLHLGEARVTLNGTNSARIIGGYGLTEVDASFMETWLKNHADTRAVKNGFIFVQSKLNDAEAEARDNTENKNGFEGVNPKEPVKGTKGITKIKENGDTDNDNDKED